MQLHPVQEGHAPKSSFACSSSSPQLEELPANLAAECDWDQDESDPGLRLTPSGNAGNVCPSCIGLQFLALSRGNLSENMQCMPWQVLFYLLCATVHIVLMFPSVLHHADFAMCDVQLYSPCTCAPSPSRAWRRSSVRSSISLGSTLTPLSCQPLCGSYSSTYLGCRGSCSWCLQQWPSLTSPTHSGKASCSAACVCMGSTQRGLLGSPCASHLWCCGACFPNVWCQHSSSSPSVDAVSLTPWLMPSRAEIAWRVHDARSAMQAPGGVCQPARVCE